MKKLNYSDSQDLKLIDIRAQHAYQTGHAKGSLNLTLSNFSKFSQQFIDQDSAIVFVTDEENQHQLDELNTLAQDKGYTHIKGFILAEDIPAEDRQVLATISVGDLLDQETGYTLLDVRNPASITRPAPEKNLTSIPLSDLPDNYSSLDNSQIIYTLCGSGNSATSAASFLTDKGYKAVVVEGGMKAIEAATQG